MGPINCLPCPRTLFRRMADTRSCFRFRRRELCMMELCSFVSGFLTSETALWTRWCRRRGRGSRIFSKEARFGDFEGNRDKAHQCGAREPRGTLGRLSRFSTGAEKPLWDKNSKEARFVRRLGSQKNRSYESYRTYIGTRPAEVVANILICLIHQTNYLLGQQLRQLEQAFLKEGGLRERMTRARLRSRPR
jgi:four helix bundle suffix protein